MEKNKRNIGPVLIILAGCFWGSMGIFVRRLGTFGFNPIQIVSIRITVAAVVFSLLLLIKDRPGFRIAFRDLPLFLGLGFGSVLCFTVCYFSAITIMPLSTAAILLYICICYYYFVLQIMLYGMNALRIYGCGSHGPPRGGDRDGRIAHQDHIPGRLQPMPSLRHPHCRSHRHTA